MQLFSTSRRKIRGQGMTEYVIIVALIAIAAIGVYAAFGNVIKGQTGAMAAELGGQNGAAAANLANTQGTGAATRGSNKSDLSNFQGEAAKAR